MPNSTMGRLALDQILGGRGLGVRDYMSGVSGMSGMQAPRRDTTLSSTPAVGGGSNAGLDIYGAGSPQVARNLEVDPLSEKEIMGLKGAQTVIGGLPFGTMVNQAIDYNMGKDVASNPNPMSANENAPNSLGGRSGFFSGKGASLTDSLKAGIATSGIGQFFGMGVDPNTPGYGQIAPDGGLRGWSTKTYADGAFTSPVTGWAPIEATPITGPAPAEESYTPSTGGNGGSAGSYTSGYTGVSSEGRQSNVGGGYTGAGADRDADGGLKVSGGTIRADGRFEGPSAYADGGMVGLTGPMYSGMNQAPQNLTQLGFADGGQIGQMGAQASPEQIQMQVAQMVRNPQFQQVAQRAVGNAMQSGELTPEELVTLGRIAEAAMHNPQLYPQLRQFALQNGLTPLPESFDPRLVTVLIAASQLMGRTPPGQVPPTDVAQMQNPNGMANGGFLQGPGTGRSDSIGTVNQTTGKPVKVANGEYVIPKHVVDAKGRDFFDKMLRQYAQLTPQE